LGEKWWEILKGWVVRMVYELGYNGLSTVINDYG
jgi:hypothetical protein